MKKNFLLILLSILVISISFSQNSIFEIKFSDINGKETSLSEYKGKKIMIVNVASRCGLTKQYEDLQKLYTEFSDKNFVIIAFPANNFLGQEPGTNEEIKNFCQKEFAISFPIMAKISVLGDDMHPLYKWLTNKKLNKIEDSKVNWNFQKYLIDENGNYVKTINPRSNPYSEEIINWIKN